MRSLLEVWLTKIKFMSGELKCHAIWVFNFLQG